MALLLRTNNGGLAMMTDKLAIIEKAEWRLEDVERGPISLWHGDVKICWITAQQETSAGQLKANVQTNRVYAEIIFEALQRAKP